MNPINVVIILASTIASSSVVSAAATSSANRDLRIDYKIDSINDPQLENVFASVPETMPAHKFTKEFENFDTLFRAKWSKATKDFEQQEKGLDEVVGVAPFNEDDFSRGPREYGRIVIDFAKKEWKDRKEACSNFSNSYMSKREIPNTLRYLSEARDTKVQEFNRLCPGKSLSKCYEKNIPILPSHMAPIKKWIFAQQMFGDPSAMAAWIKPDWRPAIQELNVPQDRFAVASIKKDLNLISRWKTNGKNLPAAIATLRANFNTIKSRIPANETALKKDFALRKAVLDAILQTNDEVSELDFDVISRRYKAFERMAEGIARNQQNGIELKASEADQITKAIKAYLMATQMFIQRGFEDGEIVKYATLPTPSGLSLTTIENNNNAEAKTDEASAASNASSINDTANKENNANTANTTANTNNSPSAKTFNNNAPAPAIDVKPADRTRSNSTDSEASTASTSSRKSSGGFFSSLFGY